jgi:hypothetical protein
MPFCGHEKGGCDTCRKTRGVVQPFRPLPDTGLNQLTRGALGYKTSLPFYRENHRMSLQALDDMFGVIQLRFG